MFPQTIFASLAVFLAVFSCVFGEIVNTEVVQSVDATTSVLRYSADVKATGVEGQYDLLFLNDWAEHLSFLSVTSKGKSLTVRPPVR
jgi:hypothetical protein